MFYEPLKKSNAVVAIVDGYSISSFYAPMLNNLGYRCIHVQSSPEIPSIYSKTFYSKNYLDNFIFNGYNLEEIINNLKKLNTQYVMVGTESGVNLTDLLSEKLGLLTNGTRRSEARRDKFEMIEALKENNLRTVNHIKSNNIEEISNWANQLNSWPIVIKQLKSAGTEKVFFCHSSKDLIDSFNKILGTKDALGNLNKEVLAETYLDGTQYLVNMVSVKGYHILSDLWIMAKKVLPGASVVHDYLKLLPSSISLKRDLVDYTRSVLNALEVQYGSSHNEVFDTKNGLTLVETGIRIMGAVNPSLIKQCIGRSQLELTLASYLQPERFTLDDMKDYELKQHLLVKMLISNQDGIVKKVRYLDEIKSLPSFVSMNLNTDIGEPVVKTIDLFTTPGTVYLCNKNEESLHKDYEKIASLEQEMFDV